jgi:arylsulfatase A-like enzyme
MPAPLLRVFLGLCALLLSPLVLCGAEGSAARRPNIVLIISDDMGYGDSTSYWKTDLQTPFMDQIGREGVRFTQFRVNPLCAPTRSSVMTGLYSLENGMWRGPSENSPEEDDSAPKNAKKAARQAAKMAKKAAKRNPDAEDADAGPASERRIKDGIQLLPQYLKAAGYATGMFGKWHLGADKKSVPNARGFDEFVGFLGGAHPYWLANNSRVQRNGQPMPKTGHTTDIFADNAIAFIKANRDRPFFCYVPFNAVHGPLRREDVEHDSAKPEWLDYYEKRGVAQPRRDYCAVMTHADARVGDILKTLRELGLEKDTLVIFHSDNGGILHTYPSNNGPLRGGKGDTYEGGIRVPAVMRWPGMIPPGTISTADAAHFDVFATILEAAGVPVPEKNGGVKVSGVSLLPHAKSAGKVPLPDRYLFWDLYGDCGALHGPWKLVGEISNHHGHFDRAAKEAEAKKFELYNLGRDLGEKNDISAQFPDIYRDLKQRHLDWLRQFANAK